MANPCCGSFVNGVPSDGCGCACSNICPPPNCPSIKFSFEVGTSYSIPVPAGCKCEPPPSAFKIDDANWETVKSENNLVPFPSFDFKFNTKEEKNDDNDDEYVFSLAENCSIPCSKIDVIITTTACGFELLGSFAVRAVGGGIVSATTSGSGDCSFTISINGGGSSAFVEDGGGISVELVSTNPCCSICLIDVLCTTIPASMRSLLYRANHISKGTKTYLNKFKLIEKIRRLKRR